MTSVWILCQVKLHKCQIYSNTIHIHYIPSNYTELSTQLVKVYQLQWNATYMFSTYCTHTFTTPHNWKPLKWMFANFVKHPCTLCAKILMGKTLMNSLSMLFANILYLAKSTQVFEFHNITRGFCPTVVCTVRDRFRMATAKVSYGFPGSLIWQTYSIPLTAASQYSW